MPPRAGFGHVEPSLGSHGRACPGHLRLFLLGCRKKDVDARDERGHDGGESDSTTSKYAPAHFTTSGDAKTDGDRS